MRRTSIEILLVSLPLALVVGCAVAACSSSKPAEEPEAPDPMMVDAGEATRAELGVAQWGIRLDPADGTTVIRGYDGARAARVEIRQKTLSGEEGTSMAILSVKGLGADAHMTMTTQVEPVLGPSGPTTRMAFEMLDNSFDRDAKARRISELLGSDVHSYAPRMKTNARIVGSLAPNGLTDGLDGSLVQPVDGSLLNPDAGDASLTTNACSQLSSPCAKDLLPLVGKGTDGVAKCGQLVKGSSVELLCAGDAGAGCSPSTGTTATQDAQACADTAKQLGDQGNAKENSCAADCGGSASDAGTGSPGTGTPGSGSGGTDAGSSTIKCGPEVTNQVHTVLASMRRDFASWDAAERESHCNALDSFSTGASAWDIFELHNNAWILGYRPVCASQGATPPCGSTVQVGSDCYYAGSPNYVVYGVMCKLCYDHYTNTHNASGQERFTQAKMEYWIRFYKTMGGLQAPAANLGPATQWAIAGYNGWPSAPSPAGDRNTCDPSCPTSYSGRNFDYVWRTLH